MNLKLSPREMEALLLYADGYKAEEAAKEMGYTSSSTFWTLIYDIRQKLEAKTNPHIIALAYHHGILKAPTVSD